MNLHIFQVVDMHTMGEPTRIVTTGLPFLRSTTMVEKKRELLEKYDDIRKLLMYEPRGHENMFGAVLVPPVDSKADLGVIFMDHGNYLNMCVHGSIGVATAAKKLGWVTTDVVRLDTPAGLVECRVEPDDTVFVRNVPSFYVGDGHVLIQGQTIPFDIAFGGSFFALVDVRTIGLELTPNNLEKLSDLGVELRHCINATSPPQHPERDIRGVDLVEFYDLAQHMNVVVFGDGQIDRSPCGTGTCAQLARLYSNSRISAHEPFVYKSILNTEFVGKILAETKVGPYNAVIPEIGGKAWVTGLGQLVVEPDDPFQSGFALMGG